MSYDPDDTIAAVASAAGGAGRGVVRVSGPGAIECLAACFVPEDGSQIWASLQRPTRVAGSVRVNAGLQAPPLLAPGELFVWPGERSYTRQPSAEFHTLGSPPVVSAVLGQLCRRGARPARPGEFTLRAFLAGRIDLVQAEAVLGVVEARDGRELGGALEQLAGGLSRPLNWLREQLLGLLAELEAGLDFADEHIEFISPEEVRARLDEGRRVVAGGLAQISSRDRRSELQRVVITGPPNVGKSLLFNALVERYGAAAGESAIVSATPGSTRDYLKTPLELSGVACELVDAAGQIEAATAEVDLVTQQMAAAQRARSNLELRCVEAHSATAETIAQAHCEIQGDGFVVVTKVDLAEPRHVAAGAVPCSSATGRGIDQLAAVVRRKLEAACQERAGTGYAAATASRCLASLEEADRALRAASELAGMAGDELVAAEVRVALAALGNVVGHVAADDVLDRIFSQFCIGK